MGALATIFTGPIISALADGIFGRLESAWEAYVKKEITKDQLLNALQQALVAALADVEKALLDSIAKTYSSFMQAMVQNPVMQRAWSITLYSQLFVLFWHQFCIPFIVFMGWAKAYPSSGATVDWSYALIALCLGVPQISTRVGSAANWASDNFKKVLGK